MVDECHKGVPNALVTSEAFGELIADERGHALAVLALDGGTVISMDVDAEGFNSVEDKTLLAPIGRTVIRKSIVVMVRSAFPSSTLF